MLIINENFSRSIFIDVFYGIFITGKHTNLLGRDNQKELTIQGHPNGGETMYIIFKDSGHSLLQLLHFLRDRKTLKI